eukprot:scaffold147562_cov42-Attheya_sp.AAC.2
MDLPVETITYVLLPELPGHIGLLGRPKLDFVLRDLVFSFRNLSIPMDKHQNHKNETHDASMAHIGMQSDPKLTMRWHPTMK